MINVRAHLSYFGHRVSTVSFNVEQEIVDSRDYPIIFQSLVRNCHPSVNPYHCLMVVDSITQSR